MARMGKILNKRFKKIHSDSHGPFSMSEIYQDSETGVCYLWHQMDKAGGLTPLLSRDGKPVILD